MIETYQYGLFYAKWNERFDTDYEYLRLGQAFHQHFQLHKSTQFKNDYDKLYQLDGIAAEKKIHELFVIC